MLKCEIIGNLGADAEVKEANGNKFVTFRVANTTKWTDQRNETHESTIWVDCTYSNVESKVIQFLKSGVKVYVRGNASLRVYSSQKNRMMMAGLQIAAQEIELCGGSSDEVPRQLVDPDTSAIVNVTKWYWTDIDTKGMKKDDLKLLVDTKGNQYGMNKGGFIKPVPPEMQGGQQAEDNGQS